MFRSIIQFVALPVFLVAILVAGTWMQQGTGMATRVATTLCMPVGLVWLLSAGLVAHSFARRQWACAAGCLLAFGLIGLTGSSATEQTLMRYCERGDGGRGATPNRPEPYAATFVLGGGLTVSPDGAIEVGCDGDRMITAAQMWHAGQTKRIVCTGSSDDGGVDPSSRGRTLLRSLAVPGNIIDEIKAANTSRELAEIARWLGENDPRRLQRYALITSAFHMPRAMRLAQANDLDLDPVSVAFRGKAAKPFRVSSLTPTAGAMQSVSLLLKEWLAGWFGR